MKNKRYNFFRGTFQLILLGFVLLIGLGGFWEYYWKQGLARSYAGLRAVYSTIRLFGANLDVDPDRFQNVNHGGLILILFETARLAAVFLSGNVLFRLLRPITSGMAVKLRTWRWELRKNQILIVGDNPQNHSIYRSIEKSGGAILLAPSLDDCDGLARQGIRAITRNVVTGSKDTDLLREQTERWIVKLLEKAVKGNKTFTIILNTQDNEINLHLCRTAVTWLKDKLAPAVDRVGDAILGDDAKMGSRAYVVDVLERLRIYAFGDRDYRSVYLDLKSESFGVIKYLNRYQATAFEFVRDHPFTDGMTEKMFTDHFSQAAVVRELHFNRIFVGFGETNQEIFAVSFANDQYVEKAEGELPRPMKVCYHIFDRNNLDANKVLNHTLFRYRDAYAECLDSGAYFELPEFPAEVRYYGMDVNGGQFYRTIREICTKNQASVNQIVISIGSDLENMDLAQRLAEKQSEWGLKNLSIFAKVRSTAAGEIGACADKAAETAAEKPAYTTFGNEEEQVYQYQKIKRDTLEELGIQRNLMYAIETDRKEGRDTPISDLQICSEYDWYVKFDNNMRLSNMYGILSLRMKLQLLGLDFTDGEKPEEAGDTLNSNGDYFRIYADRDRVLSTGMHLKGDIEKDVYSYEALPKEEEFEEGSARNNLAAQEHCRWNAFMISQGFVPQTRELALQKKGKNYLTRKHVNLSTFRGLFDYRKAMAQATGNDEVKYDVIRYDYQIMDDAWWFLHAKGYTVYKRWK